MKYAVNVTLIGRKKCVQYLLLYAFTEASDINPLFQAAAAL
jgi:hypothetical protein